MTVPASERTDKKMTEYAIGIDIGGTTAKLGLFAADTGNLTEQWEIPTRREEEGRYILPDIAASLREVLIRLSIPLSRIRGAGLGIPGPVLEERIVNRGTNLGWGRFDVCAAFRELSGISRVKAGNDANVAALGEARKGGAAGYRSAVLITLGTGIGAGIILNGQIISGANGAAGEIGHFHVRDGEPEACGCGLHGCLEQYASATGLVRLARQGGADFPVLTAKTVMDRAKAGDPACLSAVAEAAELLGDAMARISAVVDPEIFLIGGGVSQAGEFLFSRIRSAYRARAFHPSRDTIIRPAELGPQAGIYGAAHLIL